MNAKHPHPAPPHGAPGRVFRRVNFWLFALLLLGVFGFSVYIRTWQYDVWKLTPSQSFLDGVPMMTTHDAYAWFKWARNYERAAFDHDPDYGPHQAVTDPRFYPESIPMLSFLIAAVTRITGAERHLVGILMIPWLSSLFVLPLGWYFYRVGWAHTGLIAGVIGTVAYEYYARTCVGRVDSDALNLFFPFLIAACILAAGTKDKKHTLVFSALAGLSCYLFYWWYERPLFTVLYFAVFLVHLPLNRVSLKTLVPAALLFVFFAGPFQFVEGLPNLVSRVEFYANVSQPLTTDNAATAPAIIPNMFTTISETENLGWTGNLQRVLTDANLSLAGLVLFALFALRRYRYSLPTLPLFAAGLFAFKSGRRFLMFLGPSVGIGYGFALELVLEGATLLWMKIKRNRGAPSPWPKVLLYPAAFALTAAIAPKSALWTVPQPVIKPEMYASILKLKEVLPPLSHVWTVWDYGYFVNDVAEMHTYQDGGGTQFTPLTYLMFKGFSSDSQKEMHKIMSVMHNPGRFQKYMGRMEDVPELMKNLKQQEIPLEADNVYALFTLNRLHHFSLIYNMGEWDFQKGAGPEGGTYKRLACKLANANTLDCPGGMIDMSTGTIQDGKPFLARTLVVKNGVVTKDIPYDHKRDGFKGWYLELIVQDNRVIEYLLMDKRRFDSNFNQLFLLGRADPRYFEEVYSSAPVARVFKAKRTAP